VVEPLGFRYRCAPAAIATRAKTFVVSDRGCGEVELRLHSA